jgi:hypothetical protein
MNEFRWVEAWERGYRLVAARPWQNMILLIGFGLLLPFCIQAVLTGPGAGGPAIMPGIDAATLDGLAISYMLQIGALFAVLRLGLGDNERFGRALAYGGLAGVVATVVAGVLVFVAVTVARPAPPGLMHFVIMATLIPFALALAVFSTVLAALVGTTLVLVLAVTMVLGATTGNVGLAATVAGGGSGFMVVLLLLLGAALVWVSARLSCTAAIMADHRNLNLAKAIRDSWELTSEEQGRITLYLALLGAGFLALCGGAFAAIGAGLAAMQETAPSPFAIGLSLAFALVLGLLFTFLAALVPAGIYLRLAGERSPVEVFA